jgi:hypothetical protein
MTLTNIFKNVCRSFDSIFYQKKNCVLILVYHNIQNIKQLEKQINFYQKKFDIISLNEAVRLLSGNKDFDSKVVLTFDDGYNSVYPIVKNITKKIPVCIYLSTYNIESRDFFWWDIFRLTARKNKKLAKNLFHIENLLKKIPQEKRENKIEELKEQYNIKKGDYIHLENYSPLSWENINEMKKYNVDFQAHGHYHYVMLHTSMNTLKEDIQLNKKIIEKNISSSCIHFAYPGGYFNDEIITLVKDNNFVSAVTIKYGINKKNTNLFQLYRIGISDHDSIPIVTLKIYGLWKIFMNIEKLKKRFRGGVDENRMDK